MMYPTTTPYTHFTPEIQNSIEMVSVSIGAYQQPQYVRQTPESLRHTNTVMPNSFDPFHNPIYPPQPQQSQPQQSQPQQSQPQQSQPQQFQPQQVQPPEENQAMCFMRYCCHFCSICAFITFTVPIFSGFLQGISSCFNGCILGCRSCRYRST
jgi:hypothetical protein